ncbi:uncharacterized protein LOC135163431 [Diachasmimorpha longicaudata]|uniref:uncharacterized protein LOC135163431 n=1 Tax=Diachasmimorpha longicaudata TaxID=58733 RepID=UPI0030B8C632
MNETPEVICDDCRERIQNSSTHSSRPDEWDCFMDFQQIKIKMRERQSEEDKSSRSSTPSRKDAGVVANIDNVEEKKTKGVRLPKIMNRNFTSDVKRLEDIKVKERVYDVMTNDRILTKLRPMRLNDSEWILAFIENYLGVDNRPMGYFPARKLRR